MNDFSVRSINVKNPHFDARRGLCVCPHPVAGFFRSLSEPILSNAPNASLPAQGISRKRFLPGGRMSRKLEVSFTIAASLVFACACVDAAAAQAPAPRASLGFSEPAKESGAVEADKAEAA